MTAAEGSDPVARAAVRVLHTTASVAPARGGPSRTVPALVRALQARGVDAELLVAERPGRPAWMGAARLAGVIKAAARESPAVIVHDHGLWLPTNHAAAVAASRAHVPRVVSPRGMLAAWALAYRRWKKRIAWAVYQRRDLESALLHATSEEEAEGFRALGLRNLVAVVPNGVAVPPTTPRVQAGPTQTALFLGRLHQSKGLPSLIEAWARVRPAGWTLLVVGPSERGTRTQVKRAVEAHGLAGQVRLRQAVDDATKWTILQQADLFILPTLSENFGLAIAEALACGVPVITTKAAPWREIETHRCGWWIDVGVEPLAAALREATATSLEVRAAMGDNGRRLVSERYPWDRAAVAMAELYEWMVFGGTHPDCLDPGDMRLPPVRPATGVRAS